MIFGKVGDIKELLRKLENAHPTIENSVQLALKESAIAIHKEAVQSIRRVSKGERQRRYNPKRWVTVSKEGDAPNSDSGILVQSIQFEVEKDKAFVGSNLKYAVDLEFGTRKMAARPWLAPALQKTADQISEIMRAALNTSVQKSLGIKGLFDKFNKIAKAGSKSVRGKR